jgi:hypothetical protein
MIFWYGTFYDSATITQSATGNAQSTSTVKFHLLTYGA